MKNKMKKIFYVVLPLIVFIALCCGFGCSKSNEHSKEMIVYDLIVKSSENFAYPSSIVVVSGDCNNDDSSYRYAFLTLTYKNNLGLQETSYFWFNEKEADNVVCSKLDPADDKETYSIMICQRTNKLDYEFVNQQLKDYWLE